MSSFLLLLLSLATTAVATSQMPRSFNCTVTQKEGCYLDGGEGKASVLRHQIGLGQGRLMTQEYCANLVAERVGVAGMADVVVGVEYGVQCFYDTKVSSSAVKKADTDCSMACGGDTKETCGGRYRLEAFRATCPKLPPMPPYPPGPLPTEGPCDILGAAGNPCVAAHSTTRALYKAYNGPLYNLTRRVNESSAPESTDIGVLGAGGFANAPAQDAFCKGANSCIISNIYDQSPMHNHLGQRHQLVDATKHKITMGPNRVPVYGMWFDPGYGYHVDNTTGIATGNDPESIFAVLSGTHFNSGCCFDYGNSEVNDKDDGPGTMEAIYFGNAHWRGNTGAGDTGPWVGADLEQGMYYGGGNVTKINLDNKPLAFEFVTTSVKGRTDGFTIKGGDATKGTLATMYDGPRPTSGNYQPSKKQGAIILATGGDNSNSAEGNFYEGYMTTGYTSEATDAAVQANIIAAGYRTY